MSKVGKVCKLQHATTYDKKTGKAVFRQTKPEYLLICTEYLEGNVKLQTRDGTVLQDVWDVRASKDSKAQFETFIPKGTN